MERGLIRRSRLRQKSNTKDHKVGYGQSYLADDKENWRIVVNMATNRLGP